MNRWLFVLLVCCFVGSLNGMATEPLYPEVMLVIDGSGSMDGDAGGQTKMEAAKEVLTALVPELPPEVRTGLAAYGHRSGDCNDVEIIIPPGSNDRDALTARAQAIQPQGKTPISKAITQVANAMASRDSETTIILISDGKETCGGDPCETVRALKAAGAKFILHVVGFDVPQQDQDQLACIAEAGGGTYFSAGDKAALLAALMTVNKEVAQKVEKARSKTVRRKTGLGKFRLVVPESAMRALAGLKIVRIKDQKVIKEGGIKSADSTHPLMSGDYQLILQFANPNYKPPTEVPITEFAINKGETTEVVLGSLVFNIAEELNDLSVSAVLVRDKASGETYLKAEPLGNDYYLFKPKAIPAGTYDIVLAYYRSPLETTVASDISVEAGKESYVTLDSGIVLKEPEMGGIQGWDLVPVGTDTPILSVRRGWDNDEPLWRQFIVPPGEYDLYINVKDMSEPLPVGEGLVIQSGETLEFDAGL